MHTTGAARRARPDEATAVAALMLRSRRSAGVLIPPMVHTDAEVHEWYAQVVLPQRETWVVDGPGGLAALLVLEPGWIDQLYVDASRGRQGLGSALVDVAKSAFPTGVDLWTFATNTPAQRFYEHHGFMIVDQTDGDNEEGAPDLHYHWPAG